MPILLGKFGIKMVGEEIEMEMDMPLDKKGQRGNPSTFATDIPEAQTDEYIKFCLANQTLNQHKRRACRQLAVLEALEVFFSPYQNRHGKRSLLLATHVFHTDFAHIVRI